EWYKDLDDCYRNGIDISGVPGIQRLQVACVGITYGMLQQRSSHLGFVIFVEPARLAQDKLNPANFFVIDTFHVCHKGIATLSDYQLLGASKDFTKHMQVLYDEARTWCAGRHEYLHMTGLTKDVLGLDTMADYPVGRWFKGADTPLLAKFLQYRYCRALADCDEADEPVFRTIHAGLKHINGFMRAIYEQPLWVEPNDAANIAQMGLGFMRALNLAAQQ
ncbi:unnamed protein product, partial [Symbiodinium sp. KB8]